MDLIEEEGEKAVKKQYPSLEQFKEQIDFYEGLHEQMKGGFQLKFVSIGWVINHMTCNNSSALIG